MRNQDSCGLPWDRAAFEAQLAATEAAVLAYLRQHGRTSGGKIEAALDGGGNIKSAIRRLVLQGRISRTGAGWSATDDQMMLMGDA